jgi:hypothetical protein
MFKLKNLFFKETFISFYIENDTFYVQKLIIKNSKTIYKEYFKQNRDEFVELVNNSFIENTQTYISTIIPTFNQGLVDSCEKQKYKQLGINVDNIKILCIGDYSLFIGVYELNSFIKECKPYRVDFVFSPFLLIELHKQNLDSSLYIVVTNDFVLLTIYTNQKPNYTNMHQFKIEEIIEGNSIDQNSIDSIDDMDIIDDIEDIDSLDDLDDIEDIDNVDDIDISDIDDKKAKDEILNTKNEIEIIEFIRNSIKDYYNNYESDFLERLYVLTNQEMKDVFLQTLKEEFFLEVEVVNIDILDDINNLAIKESSEL